MTKRPSKSAIRYLFLKYAANLTSHFPDVQGVFVCPLCFRGFVEKDIDANKLSIEHIIPGGVGGKLTTLTCRACNNQTGTTLDSHLVRRLQVEDTLAGVGSEPLRTTVSVGQGRFQAELRFHFDGEQPQIDIIHLPRQSDPKLHSLAQNEFMESGGREFSISGGFGYRENNSTAALLRSAYLLMFHYFGYGYILWSALDQVRDQIREPDPRTDVLNGVLRLGNKPFEQDQRQGLTLMWHPETLKCFFAVFDISTKQDRHVGVMLPGLDDGGMSLYSRLVEYGLSNLATADWRFRVIPYDAACITDTKLRHSALAWWRAGLDLTESR